MKQLLMLLFLSFSVLMYGQNYKQLISTANAHYEKKEYQQSFTVYKEAFTIEKKNANDLYNAACSAALAGEKKTALKWLDLAIKNGWRNLKHVKTDSDLNSLHDSKKWDKLIATLQKEVDKIEANYDKPLQAELLKIHEEDQKYRQQISDVKAKFGQNSNEMKDLWKTINSTDSINLIKIKAILDKHGWVGADKVGSLANQTLFLVIQHSNLATQQHYLPMMREAVKNKKASASSLALLEDRIALREGKRQIYGSQIGTDYDTGKSYVLPLDDPDNVDTRRASVGLGLLADYVLRWKIVWNVEEYKKQLPEIEAKQIKQKK